MEPLQRHHIERYRFDLYVSDVEAARAVQQAARAAFDRSVGGVLEEVFDLCTPPGLTLRLDRLEVDLGRLEGIGLGEDFGPALREALLKALEPYRPPQTAPRPAWLSPRARRLELVQHLLSTGLLPWWAPHAPPPALDALLLEVLEETPQVFLAWLRAPAQQHVAARLVRQASPAVFDRLLDRLLQGHAAPLQARLASWSQVLHHVADTAEQRHAYQDPEMQILPLREAVLRHALRADAPARLDQALLAMAGTGGLPPLRLLRPAARRLLEPEDPVFLALIRSVEGEPQAQPGRAGSSRPAAPRPEEQIQPPEPPPSPSIPGRDAPVAPPGASGEPDASTNPSRVEGERLGRRGAPPQEPDPPFPFVAPATSSPDAPPPAAQVVYTTHAGLVLVWPFLRPAFDGLGWLARGRFVDEGPQHRAVLLLHLLASDEPEAAEPLLVLHKLLAGVAPSTPIPRRITPSVEERAALTAIVDSVLGHWTALGSTSAQGLRDAFLRRPGRLTPGDRGWTLLVERNAYDVLLDTLPWPLGLVAQPWMPQPLTVEW